MSLSIRNCPFAFRCDRKWANLKKTGNPDVKFCGDCQKEVYRCRTDEELAEAVALNRCIALIVDDFIGQDDGPPPPMGLIAPPGYRD